MKVIDGHCDVLYKMYNNEQIDIHSQQHLDATLQGMQEVGMLMQSFAIYISEHIDGPDFTVILDYIDLFHDKILSTNSFHFIQTKRDLIYATEHQKIGAFLTLEGADALQGNFTHLRTMHRLGVRSIGLTWNYSNWAADGVWEPRQGGLTLKGRELVKSCNELGIILDVSHLTEQGFWELNELSKRPFIASHSNVKPLCNHPRNLTDDQIEAIIKNDGIIGITFVPDFLNDSKDATIDDVIRHLDYVCSLGGERNVAFGSDFDGIDTWVKGLERTEHYVALRDALLEHFDEKKVEHFLWKNWYEFYSKELPS